MSTGGPQAASHAGHRTVSHLASALARSGLKNARGTDGQHVQHPENVVSTQSPLRPHFVPVDGGSSAATGAGAAAASAGSGGVGPRGASFGPQAIRTADKTRDGMSARTV